MDDRIQPIRGLLRQLGLPAAAFITGDHFRKTEDTVVKTLDTRAAKSDSRLTHSVAPIDPI
ncbi:MAG: hypothetical protein ACKVK3_09255 [Acidimicrobiales bacterium]